MKLEYISMVKEHLDMFLENLPSLPPDRNIEFTIDLIPSIAPIFMAPYRMTPLKLQELKIQL